MLDDGQSRVVYYNFTSIYIAPRGFVGRTEYERILSVQNHPADEKRSHVRVLSEFLNSLNPDEASLRQNMFVGGPTEELLADIFVSGILDVFWENKRGSSFLQVFFGTSSGMMRLFPAQEMRTRSIDPPTRSWYKRALSQPGRLVVSSPYIDGASGDIVLTLSVTVNHRKPGARQPAGVLGADIALPTFKSFIMAELLSNGIDCEHYLVTCAVFDGSGTLFMHDALDSYVSSFDGESAFLPLLIQVCGAWACWCVTGFKSLLLAGRGATAGSVSG